MTLFIGVLVLFLFFVISFARNSSVLLAGHVRTLEQMNSSTETHTGRLQYYQTQNSSNLLIDFVEIRQSSMKSSDTLTGRVGIYQERMNTTDVVTAMHLNLYQTQNSSDVLTVRGGIYQEI